jgi:hypothetical protein
MPTVIEIVALHLRANGFTGLVSSSGGCGCEVDDLAPCGGIGGECSAGYKHFDPRPENEGEFGIWSQQAPPTVEQWEGAEADPFAGG